MDPIVIWTQSSSGWWPSKWRCYPALVGPTDDIAEPLPAGVNEAVDAAWAHLGRAGRWWTGPQRLAMARIARDTEPVPDGLPPSLSFRESESGPETEPLVAALAERVAVAPATLTRDLVRSVTDRIGDAAYAELCAVIAQVVAVDHLRRSLGYGPVPLPDAEEGDPTRERPDGMADVGGHIEMRAIPFGPNVARSLSLGAEDCDRWLGLVITMYAGAGFQEMVWSDHPLGRPQVELLAARTSALNECFY